MEDGKAYPTDQVPRQLGSFTGASLPTDRKVNRSHTGDQTWMEAPQSLLEFFRRVNSELGIDFPASLQSLPVVQADRIILSKVNAYFYQTHRGIGSTRFNEDEYQYFSEFHRYWEANYEHILDLRIDSHQAERAARGLAAAVSKYGRAILEVVQDTRGLSNELVAQVRFFSANQDFRAPPEKPYEKYLEDPSVFEPAQVEAEPEHLLKSLGSSRLSQNDKRIDFARNAARFLIQNRISAFQIADHFGNDAVRIRDGLVSSTGMGYAQKKANMFVRDMIELGVWPNLSNFDGIDVASDINTMKVGLRSGILKSSIPLVSSFLDIFCHQYTAVDRYSAAAWRKVWEEWRRIDPATAPASPSQMDYLLYRIGRQYCKAMVAEYRCSKGHGFRHFGTKVRRCRECAKGGVRSELTIPRTLLPCQIESVDLPREKGVLLLGSDNLLWVFDGVCPLEVACMPKLPTFRPLDPPKSISILGQTSWTQSYADAELGGGGMMG